MNDRMSRFFLPSALVACCLAGVLMVVFRPGYLTNADNLGMLIFLELVLAVIWNYRQRFFPFLILVFIFSGTGVPPMGFWHSGRWFVLGVGALAGLFNYVRDHRHHFGMFHLTASFCVLAAIFSSLVSSYPNQALLKALSLLLLFLYAACGIRLAVAGREESFFPVLLLGCELLVYITAICYFIAHFEFFGNPNSLGAVMGVLVVPVMLWEVVVTERPLTQKRRILALSLSLLLLLSSYARAGILAAAVSCILLCVALRRYRTLLLVMGSALLMALVVATMAPAPSESPQSLASSFVYKGHQESGVLGSRKTVWQQALASVREHRWFGTGFGTSATGADATEQSSRFVSGPQATREHGSSYLAILEWVGAVGAVPFFALVFMVAINVGRSLAWMRRSGNPSSLVVPIAAVMAAGLVHAAFEDWLFAVGYYLCVFFWTLAFVLVDLLPAAHLSVQDNHVDAPFSPLRWSRSFGAAHLPTR